jgi:hypothetical protein
MIAPGACWVEATGNPASLTTRLSHRQSCVSRGGPHRTVVILGRATSTPGRTGQLTEVDVNLFCSDFSHRQRPLADHAHNWHQRAIAVRCTANPAPGRYALTRSGTSAAGSDVDAAGSRVAGATGGTVWSTASTGGVTSDAGFRVYKQALCPRAPGLRPITAPDWWRSACHRSIHCAAAS